MRSTSTSRLGRYALLTVTVALIMPITAHAESLDATVSFVEVTDEAASPTRVYRHKRNLDLSVIDRSRVSDWNSRLPGRPNERAQNLNGRIGTPVRVGIAALLWRLDGPDTVVRETDHPSFVETITITFHPGGCDATLAYRLKPNYAYFGMWDLKTGVPMAINRMRAENVRCKLGAVAVS